VLLYVIHQQSSLFLFWLVVEVGEIGGAELDRGVTLGLQVLVPDSVPGGWVVRTEVFSLWI
jgi:hypothetical protein